MGKMYRSLLIFFLALSTLIAHCPYAWASVDRFRCLGKSKGLIMVVHGPSGRGDPALKNGIIQLKYEGEKTLSFIVWIRDETGLWAKGGVMGTPNQSAIHFDPKTGHGELLTIGKAAGDFTENDKIACEVVH